MPILKRGRTRVFVIATTAVVALALTGAASAEFPYMNYGPSILGTPQEGQTLRGQTGQWLYTSGFKCEAKADECTYSYTWQRCAADASGCVDVPGRTGFEYLLGADDVGKRIRLVEWVYKRDCGEVNRSTGQQECADVTRNGVSDPTALVQPRPVSTAQSTAPPTIQGLAMEEEVLRATGGTWTGPGTINKAIYWQRCNAVGEACATIVGATGNAYKITSADVGARLRVIETAANEGGVAQAVSTPTAVVVELKPTAARPWITVAKVNLPNRLILDQVLVSQAGSRVTLRVRVSEPRGFRVKDALVTLTPTGLLSGSGRAATTDAGGFATFRYTARGTGTTYVYAEARRKGEKPQSGIGTARLFRIAVR